MTGSRVGLDHSWPDFAAQLAEVAEFPVADITPRSRLVEDLNLDSIALLEVLVFVVETYEPPSISQELESRRWEGVTVGALYQECVGRGPPQAGAL